MRIIRSPRALSSWSRSLHREGIRIGMVPTMGALHDGHRSLLRLARLACDAVVVSIFVNPTQFGPGEDLACYPRSFTADAAMCRKEGIDLLFAPSADALYPSGFQTRIMVGGVSERWEGKARPGHFSGVATVVTKLFSLAEPDDAFFGQKDYQQLLVVARLTRDLNLPTRIRLCPTVRESDGLAMSSRNAYLTPAQRRAAPVLFAALQEGRASIRKGIRTGPRLTAIMADRLAQEPLATLEYLVVCDPDSLEPVSRVTGRVVLLGAMRIGNVRLIDNLLVQPPGQGAIPAVRRV